MITYSLDNGNSAIFPGYAPPYGSVQVNLTDSTHATITFTSDTVAGNIYLFGGAQAIDVNVNATTFSIGTVVGSNAGTGFSPGQFTPQGSQNVDGRGVFNETIDSDAGYTHAADTVTFTLTDTSGSWANASSVLLANGNGNFPAAHIFVTTNPADASGSALVTGYAGSDTTNTPRSSVPDGGSTAILLGSAMVGLGSLRLCLRRK